MDLNHGPLPYQFRAAAWREAAIMPWAAMAVSRASRCAVSLLSFLLSPAFQSWLGYEHHDVRLRRLGRSLADAATSADGNEHRALGLLRLPCLTPFRGVRFTNRFTVRDQFDAVGRRSLLAAGPW